MVQEQIREMLHLEAGAQAVLPEDQIKDLILQVTNLSLIQTCIFL